MNGRNLTRLVLINNPKLLRLNFDEKIVFLVVVVAF